MAIHDDGTMDVRVDGVVVRRRYSINREAPFSNRYFDRIQTKYMPDLKDGEEAIYTHTDDVPTIVKNPHHRADPLDTQMSVDGR